MIIIIIIIIIIRIRQIFDKVYRASVLFVEARRAVAFGYRVILRNK